MFTNGMTQTQILASVQGKLNNLANALEDINKLYRWASGLSAADLQAAPLSFSNPDAVAILTAINDAHAEFVIHTTGQAPGSYPQVTNPYNFGASQSALLGAL
jgi:hypothetical protein